MNTFHWMSLHTARYLKFWSFPKRGSIFSTKAYIHKCAIIFESKSTMQRYTSLWFLAQSLFIYNIYVYISIYLSTNIVNVKHLQTSHLLSKPQTNPLHVNYVNCTQMSLLTCRHLMPVACLPWHRKHAKLLVSETFPGNATPPLGRCNRQGVGRCATEIAPDDCAFRICTTGVVQELSRRLYRDNLHIYHIYSI